MTTQGSARRRPLVLLVEDEPVQALLMTQELQQAGWRVRFAANGQDAFEAACIAARRPDVVVMDVVLPGLSGIEATLMMRDYEQRRGLRRVPVLGCSGLARPQTHSAMLRAGMDDVLHKPYPLGRLVPRVKALLEGAPGRADPRAEPSAQRPAPAASLPPLETPPEPPPDVPG